MSRAFTFERGVVAAAALACACACAAGCSEPQHAPPFSIALSFRGDSGGMCPTGASCGDFAMPCNAMLGIRIADAKNPAGPALAADCRELDPAKDLCSLSALDLEIDGVPARQVQVEVALWRRDLLPGDPPTCPSGELFDASGLPRADLSPKPAFAGAAAFDAGSSATVARVPLSCSDPAELAASACTPPSTAVAAHMDDIETGQPVTAAQAAGLDISVAEPRPQSGSSGVWAIAPSDTYALSLAQSQPTPLFQADVPATFGDVVCTVALASVPQATSAVTCAHVTAGASMLTLHGYALPKSLLDQILAALGASSFPATGLVVGRVVDDTGAPLAGVTVSPAQGKVEYLSADATAVTGASTSASGYFLSTDAPFDTQWTAAGPNGGQQSGAVRAGLVEDRVTVFSIAMQPPSAGTDAGQ